MKAAFAIPPTEQENKFWQHPEISAGSLKVVLASNRAEVELAQSLRYDIFVNEIGAKPGLEARNAQRDFDEFDDVCDHLLVVDTSLADTPKNPVVGTYRLIRGTAAGKIGRFYSQSEYDLSKIASFSDDILELGRSCVHKDYRDKATLQLLWRGIGAYLAHYNIKMMFGCASFHGSEVEPIKTHLSYLHHFHLAPEGRRAVALPGQYINMGIVPREECQDKSVRVNLPPLVKGYLGVGAEVGDGAVYDSVCNTIDIFIVVQTDRLNARYARKFVSSPEAHNNIS